MNKWDYAVKVILVGDTNTGKTSMLYDFQNTKIDTTPISTIGVEFGSFLQEFNNNYIKYNIWDTAGQEKYRSITYNFFKHTAIALLFFDLTNYKTFVSIRQWLHDLKRFCPENVNIILLGNKKDLESHRQVQYNEAFKIAESHSIPYYEISIKDNINIKDIITQMNYFVDEQIKNKRILPEGIRTNRFVEVKTGSSKLCSNCSIS